MIASQEQLSMYMLNKRDAIEKIIFNNISLCQYFSEETNALEYAISINLNKLNRELLNNGVLTVLNLDKVVVNQIFKDIVMEAQNEIKHNNVRFKKEANLANDNTTKIKLFDVKNINYSLF